MNGNNQTRMKVTCMLAGLMLLVAGCSKLTPENYAKLKMGMPYDEVTVVLGKPTSCNDTLGFKNCRWGNDKRNVTVRFMGEKTVLYSAENLQ